MEKHTPHYDLSVIKADVTRLGPAAFTRSTLASGRHLGLTSRDMQQVIAGLQGKMLYKSMTTYLDQRIWQDVYCTHIESVELYIKVTYRPGGGLPVISFKEKRP
ncbi:type II toxin-antitoxin system MqsR family toxin [Pseudomonas chlororaphis]|uniref:Motility quorum-sensing regulator MqsR n=1 Tax=Pseudomonas chlororaphis TaxID=587753 RepID=A0A1Q8EW68_9PSED|nr:type II toxin-antitoxin system MqsR family toxin [Pseudomonas chlororaphis]OLF56010.1 motility quorum-sensing regulator MqsR [Pseudomonas chlororaphis]